MQIVNLFYEMARQQVSIKSFRYGKGYEKGAGTDVYPLTWVDDPLAGNTTRADGGVLRWSVNVDILGLPQNDAEVMSVQDAAFLVGLSYAEKIKELSSTSNISTESFNFVSLRDYYDDKAAGWRFTFILNAPNPVNRCLDYFDPDKQLAPAEGLPDFLTTNPEGCAVFNDKAGLPNFTI